MCRYAIHIHTSAKEVRCATLLASALQRSFSDEQVFKPHAFIEEKSLFTVFAGHCSLSDLRKSIRYGGKIFVTGVPEREVLPLLGLRRDMSLPSLHGMDTAPMNETNFAEYSLGRIRYTQHPLARTSPLQSRHFMRYDYAEWNNLGYGGIRTCTNAPFAVQGGVAVDGAQVISVMETTTESSSGVQTFGPYMTLLDLPQVSILWCARPAGPLDSVEWHVVERFFSDWRAGELPCLPCLMGTPAGAQCIVTMRLDCDEAVSTARDVFDLYLSEKIPFSLAIKTGQSLENKDICLMREVLVNGGTLLSHSCMHRKNWGENYNEAFLDAVQSRKWFPEHGFPAPRFAVSPFHTNPEYAVWALKNAGYEGFVSGIIHNDPEFLLGRAGNVPFVDGIYSISQQSMLHGDSYRNQGYDIEVHAQAFQSQYKAHGIFGYLDHPFSERYQYGWQSEVQRIEAHRQLISVMRKEKNVLFWNQEQCFDFIAELANTRLHIDVKGRVHILRGSPLSRKGYFPQYRYENEVYTFLE